MCPTESSWGEKPRPRRLPLKKYSGPERRQAHRHRLTCIEVTYRRPLLWQLVKSGKSDPCPVSNISSRGVRFYTYRKLRRSTVVDMSFEVPVGVYRIASGDRLKAKIIWQKWSRHRQAWRTGARFVHVSGTTHADLVRMIDEASLHSTKF